jgi:ubiquinone/menaquinone biosynthesis C-methylase UbiE
VMGPHRIYVPAAGHDWFLPLYDPIVTLIGGDPTRRILIEQAAIQPHHRVLEIGCGTGSLVVLLKQSHPGAHVVGLDPDSRALARARRKARRAGVFIQFDRGFSNDLPYRDASFDRVLSSLMFHHVEGNDKEQTLREVRRVLKPGGRLHLLDFGGPEHRTDPTFARLLHSSARLYDNSDARILTLMSQAGLADVRNIAHGTMLFGHARINYYQASVPSPPATDSHYDIDHSTEARTDAGTETLA